MFSHHFSMELYRLKKTWNKIFMSAALFALIKSSIFFSRCSTFSELEIVSKIRLQFAQFSMNALLQRKLAIFECQSKWECRKFEFRRSWNNIAGASRFNCFSLHKIWKGNLWNVVARVKLIKISRDDRISWVIVATLSPTKSSYQL